MLQYFGQYTKISHKCSLIVSKEGPRDAHVLGVWELGCQNAAHERLWRLGRGIGRGALVSVQGSALVSVPGSALVFAEVLPSWLADPMLLPLAGLCSPILSPSTMAAAN